MVFQKTDRNRVWVDLSEMVFKNCDMKQGMDLIARFCKLYGLRGVRVCYGVRYKKTVCWRADKGKPCTMKLVLMFNWRRCHHCLQHFCAGVTPTVVSGPLISRYRRDAYCCIRSADQQIPSWRLLLYPARWSADTAVTPTAVSGPLMSR